ncbi:MAG: hypothetical protein GY832_46670 [Chloroflexi bacterium]|nr:hypothetical protein [Chloroflexota bacterium]
MNRKTKIVLTICCYTLGLAVGYYLDQMFQSHLVASIAFLAMVVTVAIVVWRRWVRVRPA